MGSKVMTQLQKNETKAKNITQKMYSLQNRKKTETKIIAF